MEQRAYVCASKYVRDSVFARGPGARERGGRPVRGLDPLHLRGLKAAGRIPARATAAATVAAAGHVHSAKRLRGRWWGVYEGAVVYRCDPVSRAVSSPTPPPWPPTEPEADGGVSCACVS